MTILVRPKKLKTYGNTKANYVNNTLKMGGRNKTMRNFQI